MKPYVRKLFRPYVAKHVFTLQLFDLNAVRENKFAVGIRFLHRSPGCRKPKVVIDWTSLENCLWTPGAIDSEEVIKTAMTFLSLRPGDTDSEYFENYTPEQLEFANTHGEVLSMYSL
jgi:hypothetical protein